MTIRKPGKPPRIHPNSEIHSFNVRGANPVLIRVAKHRDFLSAFYLCRRISRRLLAAGEILYQLGEVYPVAEYEWHVKRVASQAVCAQLKPAACRAVQLFQDTGAGRHI